jgi:hypothetical protein
MDHSSATTSLAPIFADVRGLSIGGDRALDPIDHRDEILSIGMPDLFHYLGITAADAAALKVFSIGEPHAHKSVAARQSPRGGSPHWLNVHVVGVILILAGLLGLLLPRLAGGPLKPDRLRRWVRPNQPEATTRHRPG